RLRGLGDRKGDGSARILPSEDCGGASRPAARSETRLPRARRRSFGSSRRVAGCVRLGGAPTLAADEARRAAWEGARPVNTVISAPIVMLQLAIDVRLVGAAPAPRLRRVPGMDEIQLARGVGA